MHQLVVMTLFLFAISLSAIASEKKGIGLYDPYGEQRINALNVSWYYNWTPFPSENLAEKEFVPMISGLGGRQERELRYLKAMGHVPVLLAINEPDVKNQANQSVDQIARLWPELSGLADKISSPAAANVFGSWFDRFYRIAQSRGLKMDFIAMHLYGPPDANRFLRLLDEAYEKYKMPIWITEFAVADWDVARWGSNPDGQNRFSEEQILDFMKLVLPELEKRPYIVKYAWFGAGKHSLSHEQVRTSRLFEKDGSLTPLGRFYAEFEWSEVKEFGNH